MTAALAPASPARTTGTSSVTTRLGYVGPNWYASVMGTGILPVALLGLPFHVPGAATVAAALWALAATLLVAVTAATVLHHRHHPTVANGHRTDPVMVHFYGAPAMALMTVGAGAMLAGQRWIGAEAALALHAVLWTAGTLLGIATAVLVPYAAFTRLALRGDEAFGGWLMPVVPPMVSAATGALLVPHVPAGQARESFLLLCYGLFGLTLLASLVVITLIVHRMVRYGAGPAARVPTLWIVLGPLGQSVTAAHHLGLLAPGVLPAPYGTAFESLALVYGIPVWGFAMLWLTVAALTTWRTVRAGMPFTLTWWSFTFPVGTVVTGTSGLAGVTGLLPLALVAGVLFGCLVLAWAVVLTRTVAGVLDGSLLRAPQPVVAPR
ncbi:TDT family transporter [Nocardioides sambongensis]|uniref:TDT family transporter n=1 Tax=Nocardioides sambongensis TaxID=2589074 RepID=UPI001E514693|nr:TDT family transporter [Nocardioides sambongensis]